MVTWRRLLAVCRGEALEDRRDRVRGRVAAGAELADDQDCALAYGQEDVLGALSLGADPPGKAVDAGDTHRLEKLLGKARADRLIRFLNHGEGQTGLQFGIAEAGLAGQAVKAFGLADRSEEHTSELQSLMRISYAV